MGSVANGRWSSSATLVRMDHTPVSRICHQLNAGKAAAPIASQRSMSSSRSSRHRTQEVAFEPLALGAARNRLPQTGTFLIDSMTPPYDGRRR